MPRPARRDFPPGDARRIHQGFDTPILFGALTYERASDGEIVPYNTALMLERDDRITGSFDKNFLLIFGEYLPFARELSWLHKMIPEISNFTRGTTTTTFPLSVHGKQYSIGPMICYEDILPGFVNNLVREGDPELLVNITNDAWFGDTAEPWIHNALAKFRAVEHRRDLIRSANAGVSSIIDAAGRHVAHGGTFRRENVVGRVHLRQGNTVYYYLGDWIGWAGVLLALYAFAPQRWVRRKSA
jgi:apolipoprotein N-acyltransferase